MVVPLFFDESTDAAHEGECSVFIRKNSTITKSLRLVNSKPVFATAPFFFFLLLVSCFFSCAPHNSSFALGFLSGTAKIPCNSLSPPSLRGNSSCTSGLTGSYRRNATPIEGATDFLPSKLRGDSFSNPKRQQNELSASLKQSLPINSEVGFRGDEPWNHVFKKSSSLIKGLIRGHKCLFDDKPVNNGSVAFLFRGADSSQRLLCPLELKTNFSLLPGANFAKHMYTQSAKVIQAVKDDLTKEYGKDAKFDGYSEILFDDLLRYYRVLQYAVASGLTGDFVREEVLQYSAELYHAHHLNTDILLFALARLENLLASTWTEGSVGTKDELGTFSEAVSYLRRLIIKTCSVASMTTELFKQQPVEKRIFEAKPEKGTESKFLLVDPENLSRGILQIIAYKMYKKSENHGMMPKRNVMREGRIFRNFKQLEPKFHVGKRVVTTESTAIVRLTSIDAFIKYDRTIENGKESGAFDECRGGYLNSD